MRLVVFGSILALVGAAGCTRGTTDRDAGHGTDMGVAVDGGIDAHATPCTSDAECNDSVACTIDQCVVGGLCMHTPVDGMCTGAGEHCDTTRGCTTMTMSHCSVDGDCDDHHYCNGTEHCAGGLCAPGTTVDCDDGNPCTVDSCSETLMHCSYMTTCDSGIVMMDTGPVCTPFVAPADFNGTFIIAPSQNQGCGTTMYSLGSVTVVASGTSITIDGLNVDGTNVALTGTTSGQMFTATYSGRCGTYTLTGMFGSCRESFSGHWSTSLHCACPAASADVSGIRTGG